MATILVVDDSKVDQRLVAALLRDQGMTLAYASDGQAALDAMRAELPEVVLTDMQMPKLDGLQLVSEIRRLYPGLPVVLMTAFGSESIAAKALQRGAAHYVSKLTLARDLRTTLDQVLALARVQQAQARVLDHLEKSETHFILDNDSSHIYPLVSFIHQNLARLRMGDETTLMHIGVALDEALTNAMHHGNLEVGSEVKEQGHEIYEQLIAQRQKQEPYASRRIRLSVTLTHDSVTLSVSDQGPGFDPQSIPDPTDASNLMKVSGRGLFLIGTFMDQVHHNARGNQITMIKRRDDSTV